MEERELQIRKLVEGFSKELPHFEDGRIDYSKSDVAPVIVVFLRHNLKILLLKRSKKVLTYKGKWNAVAGYLDDAQPIREKVLEELREEVGVGEDVIDSIHIGEPYTFADQDIGKTWIIHPILVELKGEPKITLDWEHTEYRWVDPEELRYMEDIVPNVGTSYHHVQK